jgi:hydrogenase nickel incorporation protein HypA/HybF
MNRSRRRASRVHELSLCGAIADVVTRRAGQRRVEVVHLLIGQLRQVVPDTLSYCWTLVCADTDLDGSVLDIESVPCQLRCGSCAAESCLDAVPVFACSSCGSVDVEVVSGEELVVTALEVAP